MPTATVEDLCGNRLLAILSDADLQRLAPHVHSVELEAGNVLHRCGDDVIHTWFPCYAALASFRVDAGNGDEVEVAVVGSEGAIGGIVSNGNVPAFATSQVRSPGRFLRVKTAALEQVKIDSIYMRHWFSRYSDCLLAQVFQSAACNARHTIEQRTCKWLLSTADRTQSDELPMTQEELAALLGVGRSFVNRTLGKLRAEGLISTRRNYITLDNRSALMKRTCGCLTAVENHFDEVLHGIYPVS